MSSALESIRQAHEDIERLTHLASCSLQSRETPTSPHPRLAFSSCAPRSTRAAEQLARDLIDVARTRSDTLTALYKDLDSAFAAPLQPTDPFSSFYARLRDVRDSHRSAGTGAADARSVPDDREKDEALLTLASSPPTFSGEEGGGRYLDLHLHYASYLNVMGSAHGKPGATVEYFAYVNKAITDFAAVPLATRNGRLYLQYLTELLEYLAAFADRTHPLDKVDEHIAGMKEKLRIDTIKRLEAVLEEFESPEAALAGMGPNGVKNELLTLGLKCGGRPIDRASRLFKAAKERSVGGRVILEGAIAFILQDLIAEVHAATGVNVEKKLSLSYAEIEADRVAEEAAAEGGTGYSYGLHDDGNENEDVEKTLYNPKDVPLGWDGKPIPYWMYKLHGLNHEFKCEICGNATYRGPRAFERHFTDVQHVQGLRCLGISYSKEYLMVTRIADARVLQEKLKRDSEKAIFDADADMEFEDAEGNLLNKKTYNDLARQGLL